MLLLNTIRAQPGATHAKKRLGRGTGSGHGQTAGKGDKGQLARAGGHSRIGFEGGQMPLYRRIPKRGFKNFTRRDTAIVNVGLLSSLDPAQYQEINLQTVQSAKLVNGNYEKLAVLGSGELTKAFVVKAHRVSAQAKEKIQKAGGRVEIIIISTLKKKKA
ncbi:MAG: 50S ribosomal protein L15 [Bdellovibrio sp.]|nr:50S ribosomal protein L15 [Bdellovibrio sp.]